MKKYVFQFSLALLMCVGSISSAHAAMISFWSGDGGDILVSSVNPGAVTVITPHPLWGDVSVPAGLAPGTAKWISYANTGIGGFIPPNVTGLGMGDQTMHFRRKLNIASGGSLDLDVLADDTVGVTLTGPGGVMNLFLPYPDQVNPCSPGGTGNPVGCVQVDMGSSPLTNLPGGVHFLDLYVYQRGGDVSGVNFAGTYEVPEPNMIALMGAGLIGIGYRLRRKSQKS